MDSLRDVAAILPSLAVVTVSQIAAGALTTAARLLEEHGSLATVVTRHAATTTAHLTDDFGNRVSQNAIRYASTSAIAAQQSAEVLSAVTQALAAAAESAVQGATTRAQAAVQRQASSWQQYADDQALATGQRFQDAVSGVLMPEIVPQQGPSSNEQPNATSIVSPATPSAPETVTATAVAANPAQPAVPAAAVAANAAQTDAHRVSAKPTAVTADNTGSTGPVSRRTAHEPADPISSCLGTVNHVAAAGMHQILADTQQLLIVKQVVTEIFRSVERRSAREELFVLSLQLEQCQRSLVDATQHLKAAAQTTAATYGLTQQTGKCQTEPQEFAMKPLEVVASKGSATGWANSSAPRSHPPPGLINQEAGLAPWSVAVQEDHSEVRAATGSIGADEDVESLLSDLSSDFLMVDVPESAGETSS